LVCYEYPRARPLNLLEEEFRSFDEVRVIPVFPSKTERSPDLVQNYDPESKHIHRVTGVKVSTEKKEFFFPVEWFSEQVDLRSISRSKKFANKCARVGRTNKKGTRHKPRPFLNSVRSLN